MEKVVCLVSGGIDSPVACALAARSFEVIPLHFCIYPHTTRENLLLAIETMRRLKERVGFGRVLIFPWARILSKISGAGGKYTCVLCKIGMLKAAELVCEREGALAVVTGESLGQKASQTLRNMAVISAGLRLPVLRPLLTMDKLEVERLSKELGIWREEHAGVCGLVPRHPATVTRREVIDDLRMRLNLDAEIKGEMDGIFEIIDFGRDVEVLLSSLRA